MRCRTGTSGHHSGTTLGRTCDGEGYSRVHEQEALAKQQVEAARAKLEAFEAELPRSE
jgi:hypothetical protein